METPKTAAGLVIEDEILAGGRSMRAGAWPGPVAEASTRADREYTKRRMPV